MTRASAKAHVDKLNAWVADVLDGSVIACKEIKLAAERHSRDIERARTKEWPYRFDAEKAEKACRFVEKFDHVKGRWNGTKIQLEPWQCFFVGSVFGWVHKTTGLRRFRKARLYVSRKNGKSLLIAPIALKMLADDGEAGAEVFSGATNEKQAWEVFGPAKLMVQRNEDFRTYFGVEVNAKTIVRKADASKFEPVIGKPGDGSSPHCSITDEYHEHDTDDQLATFETGMGARTQPLSIIVSTAGDNLAGPCRDDWLECRKVLQRVTEDDRLFAMVFTIDPDMDWTSEAALRMANPNYDISVSAEFLLAQQREAINNPRKIGHFKTKHLNMWVQARDAFFDLPKWEQSVDATLKLADFKGKPCWLGMDLASKIDLCAIELLFEHPAIAGDFVRFGRYYLPESALELEGNTNAQSYRAWHAAGWLTITDGNQTDYFQILDDLKDIAKEFEVREFAFDPHNATMLVTALQTEGLPMVEFGPTVLNFSEPMKQVEALIRDKKLHHNGDPIMTWALSNVVAKLDRKDNVFPNKERPENKIDPAIALISAKGRYMVRPEPAAEFRVHVL